MKSKRLVIMGFGGHARSVADVALACGYNDLIFIDQNAQPGENFLGHPVIQNLNSFPGNHCDAFVSSGDGRKRQEQCEFVEQIGLPLVSLISPLASVGAGSTILPGCFVGHHAHIGPGAVIGKGCIINTGAIVEHESCVGNYSHVSVNATIAGRSRIGAHSMLGAGATIINEVSVADSVIIGAGAIVVKTISEPGTYVGMPAKRIKVSF